MPGQPGPLPVSTHTRAQGYGFLRVGVRVSGGFEGQRTHNGFTENDHIYFENGEVH